MLGPSAVQQRTDLELAADHTDGELITGFPAAAWSAIRLAGLDLALLAAAENGDDAWILALIGTPGRTRLA